MANLTVPPPTRIAIGSAMVGGQKVDLYLNPEWARYFDSLNSQVVVTSNAVGQPGAPGTTGAAGAGVSLSDEGSGGDFLPIPGPAGNPGPQGALGAALFMLQDTPESQDVILPSTQIAEAFIAPTLLNSWVNWGVPFNPVGYGKDAQGFVHLRGVIKNGTTTLGTQLFTLPAGYRPANQEIYSVASNSAYGEVRIDAAGVVTVQVGAAAFLSLDNITFRAA